MLSSTRFTKRRIICHSKSTFVDGQVLSRKGRKITGIFARCSLQRASDVPYLKGTRTRIAFSRKQVCRGSLLVWTPKMQMATTTSNYRDDAIAHWAKVQA
jgi:hypothetical protein